MNWIPSAKLAVAAAVAMACCLTVGITAQDEPSPPTDVQEVAQATPRLKAFMRKKLVAAEQILEGLTTPDYDLIRKGATSMVHMSKEAIWETPGTVAYAQDTADFVRSAERLIKLSNDQDLEGASHTYAQLTIQCVNCHRHARSQKVVSFSRGSSVFAQSE